MVEKIIETLFTDPFFVKVGIIIIILISLSILKKLRKVVAGLFLALLLYGWYVYSTGSEPISIDEIKDVIEEIEAIDEKKIKKVADKSLKKIKDNLENK
tara:strand:- start:205 stop:501 length:297 start_codon:yes stop_codon:yes gene_type:complete